jgi:hypothetical protein
MKTSHRLVLAGCAIAALATAAIAAEPDTQGQTGRGGRGGQSGQSQNNAGPQNGGNTLPSDQGYGPGGPASNVIATFYAQPNFRGAPITISQPTPDMSSVNFSRIARSARVAGDWQVCDQPNFRGHCETINGAVDDLDDFGISGAIMSARPGVFANPSRGDGRGGNDRGEGRDGRGGDDRGASDNDRGGNDRGGPGYGGGYGGGRPDRRQERYDGRTVVFFPNPTINGQPVTALGRGAADMFCRRQGLGQAVFYDTSTRGRGIGFDNRLQINVPVLSDVVCRRL